MITTKDRASFTSATETRRFTDKEMLEIGIAAALANAVGTPTIVITNPPAIVQATATSNVVDLDSHRPEKKAKSSATTKKAKTRAKKAPVRAEAPTPGKRRLASGKVIDVALPRRYKRTLKDGAIQWVGPAFRGYVNEVDALTDTVNFVGGANKFVKIGDAA